MKYAIILMLAMLGLSGAASSQVDPKIHVTSTLEQSRITATSRFHYYLLWTRTPGARPIGHTQSSCHRGVTNAYLCTSVYALPYGKIAVVAMIHNFRRFTGIITGGTRSERAKIDNSPGYTDVGGILLSRRISPGTDALIFSLAR